MPWPPCAPGTTCQLSGRAIFIGPKSLTTDRELGSTLSGSTGFAVAAECAGAGAGAEAGAEAGVVIATPGGALKTAPFCLFSLAHSPV